MTRTTVTYRDEHRKKDTWKLAEVSFAQGVVLILDEYGGTTVIPLELIARIDSDPPPRSSW